MWSKGRAPWKHRPDIDDPRRRGKRHKVDALRCDLGVVLDLSTVGMRIAAEGKPPLQVGKVVRIRLRIPEGTIAVDGRAVWMHRTGFRKYQIGIEFINVKRSISAALDMLGRFGFLTVGDNTADLTAAAGAPSADDSRNKSKGKNRNKRQRVRVSVDVPDYYSILSVDPEATEDEIRNAFRALARKHHPDVSADPKSAQQFIQIHEAYEILRDPEQRKTYDLRKAG